MSQQLDEEKKFYERFWALHNDPQLVEIYKQFGVEVFRRSSVLEGLEGFIRATGFRGHRCVEIGTLNGLTALILARYFDEVVSIDIERGRCQEIAVEFCGARNIVFETVDDNAEKAAVIDALDFDGAYVDGDHANDTKDDFRLVKRCGAVLFHEVWPAQPPVWNLIGKLRKRETGIVEASGKLALWTARWRLGSMPMTG